MGNKKSSVEQVVNGSADVVEEVKEKGTRSTDATKKGIRANLSNGTMAWLKKAEEVSGIDHSVLVEMAFIALGDSDAKTRKDLYERALALRGGKDIVSMSF